jgi:hypothetical protein
MGRFLLNAVLKASVVPQERVACQVRPSRRTAMIRPYIKKAYIEIPTTATVTPHRYLSLIIE